MAEPARITANDVVAFVVELVAFTALGTWAWRHGTSTLDSWLWVVVVLGITAGLWALFVAPKARYPNRVLEPILRVAILAAAILALATFAPPAVWIAVAVVFAVNTALVYLGPYRRPSPHD
ncbi:YrdB family protein [Gordonia sp. (in: high G+C Gram-positive bacteria)]|uniref:YrdB family protein n=1 Tax=Gordonia sp. (in: high G+C Gram-positive bacteria) TaxID=84139 RepID=UPI0039E4D825